jgi:hypothetical protein
MNGRYLISPKPQNPKTPKPQNNETPNHAPNTTYKVTCIKQIQIHKTSQFIT